MKNNNLHNLCIGFMVHYFHFSLWNCNCTQLTTHMLTHMLDNNQSIMTIDAITTLILL
jgi:hypothetical protein